jgi:hypothetical protein
MEEDDSQGTFTSLHLICRIFIEPSRSVIALRSYKEAFSAPRRACIEGLVICRTF